MNRQDFRDLTQIRLAEAQVLLDNGKYDGAYYLCGYAIECALKACIAKMTKSHDFPPKKRVIEKFYTHEISTLLGAAGLEKEFDDFIKRNNDKRLERNWAVVIRWNEDSRYAIHSEKEAKDLFSAIANKKYGVLRWIMQRW
jgi:HEPN domain-containing protein